MRWHRNVAVTAPRDEPSVVWQTISNTGYGSFDSQAKKVVTRSDDGHRDAVHI